MSSDILNVNPDVLNSTIEFLTAMITPALLISATGSLVLSTSTRLGRVIDRVRELEKRLGELILMPDSNKSEVLLYSRRVEVIFDLLDKVTSRSRLLQRAMVVFYYGLACFVLTSVSIGVVGFLRYYRWTPVFIGLVGILFLLYGSILMMLEAKMASATVNAEMDFTWELAKKVMPQEIVERYPERGIYGTSTSAAVSEVVGKRRTRKKST